MKHQRPPFLFAIDLSVPARAGTREKTALRRAAAATLDAIPLKTLRSTLTPGQIYHLSLALVSDRRSHTLNRQYREKDKPTDVLSFSRLEGLAIPSPVPEIGDVVIATGVAKRQAAEYGATYAEELERLTTHGILHCFGYDHERSPTEARRMFRLQNAILKSLSRRTRARRKR